MLQCLRLIRAACMRGHNACMDVVGPPEFPGSQREHVDALITSDVVCTSLCKTASFRPPGFHQIPQQQTRAPACFTRNTQRDSCPKGPI